MKRSPAITASRQPRSRATGSDSTPRPRCRGRWQVARTAARSAAPERPRLPAAAIGGGPPVAGQNPGRPFPGRIGLAGEAGPEARRGHRRRGARQRPALVVELGEVDSEARILERPAGEPGVHIEGRTIARSFWGRRWCHHLESCSDFENRLPPWPRGGARATAARSTGAGEGVPVVVDGLRQLAPGVPAPGGPRARRAC